MTKFQIDLAVNPNDTNGFQLLYNTIVFELFHSALEGLSTKNELIYRARYFQVLTNNSEYISKSKKLNVLIKKLIIQTKKINNLTALDLKNESMGLYSDPLELFNLGPKNLTAQQFLKSISNWPIKFEQLVNLNKTYDLTKDEDIEEYFRDSYTIEMDIERRHASYVNIQNFFKHIIESFVEEAKLSGLNIKELKDAEKLLKEYNELLLEYNSYVDVKPKELHVDEFVDLVRMRNFVSEKRRASISDAQEHEFLNGLTNEYVEHCISVVTDELKKYEDSLPKSKRNNKFHLRITADGITGFVNGVEAIYPIRGEREKMIKLFQNGKRVSANRIMELTNYKDNKSISRAKAEINEKISKLFKVSKSFIADSKGKGYILNNDDFDIEYL